MTTENARKDANAILYVQDNQLIQYEQSTSNKMYLNPDELDSSVKFITTITVICSTMNRKSFFSQSKAKLTTMKVT